jgi:hypothetical protein
MFCSTLVSAAQAMGPLSLVSVSLFLTLLALDMHTDCNVGAHVR